MISGKSCKKDTSALVHLFFSRHNYYGNWFVMLSNKDTSKCLDLLADHSFTSINYISLDTTMQSLSPFWTIILSTVRSSQLRLSQSYFSTPFLSYSIISSAIYFSCKSIDSPVLSLPASWTWSRQNLVLRRDPNRWQSARFSLNIALPLPSDVSFDTDPDIDLSKE